MSQDGKIRAEVKGVVSILPNDYVNLKNKPKINGIVLEGDLSSENLDIVGGDGGGSNSGFATVEEIPDTLKIGKYVFLVKE